MKHKTYWLLATAVTGVLVYVFIRRREHRKWEERRAAIIARAKRRSSSEFVL